MILNIAEPTTALRPGSECDVKTPLIFLIMKKLGLLQKSNQKMTC